MIRGAGPAGASLLGGRYELLALLATGGMGQVWRARDTLLRRPVALKVLRSEYTGDATFLARFRAEAQHAAVLTDRNIAALFDYGETPAEDGEHLAYLVMELVEGESLAQLLAREGRLDVRRTLDVLGQTAAGLAAAHAAGLVHRDVKPGNVLVGRDGVVKITDFGIAWSAGSAPLTQTGQLVGTAHYLSPEQAAGQKAGPASDVYALGMIGYECLAGHRAFDGDNSVQIALRHLREMPAPLPGDLPEPVRTLIDRALLKDPAERFPDGAAFRDAVVDVRAGRSLPPVPTAGDTRPFVAAGERPRPLARRLLAPVAALVVGVGLGGAALQVWGDAPVTPVAQAEAESPEPVVVRAEDAVGRPVDEVEDELTGRGLGVARTAQETAEVPAGQVVAVSPVGALPPGTVVTLAYAVAPPPTTTPTTAPAPEPVPAPVPTMAVSPAEEADDAVLPGNGSANGNGNGNGGPPAGSGAANGNGNAGNGNGNGRGGGGRG
ncbi:protein kinase domain-containing protein [Blastococcus saxobsidens]|uniref:non-specific serine/threonine protein kinase n=1 Tax=Blastococcus saxobsidens TaxID=138336 RepID=A0A4Q7YCG9_9ACTN|nr:protein kinase [Blastococcus saxobsidens]RZU33865.1 serine/threonine-protein kinase [Blastococcus saxobsidens]